MSGLNFEKIKGKNIHREKEKENNYGQMLAFGESG